MYQGMNKTLNTVVVYQMTKQMVEVQYQYSRLNIVPWGMQLMLVQPS